MTDPRWTWVRDWAWIGASTSAVSPLVAGALLPIDLTGYAAVASLLGGASGAVVGWALAAMDQPDVPWHRVINAQGRISARGDTGRVEVQLARLVAEGVRFDDTGRVDLRVFRYRFEVD